MKKNNRKEWTSEDDALLKQMKEEGVRGKKIAKQLGRSRMSVYTRLCKLGLSNNHGIKPKAKAVKRGSFWSPQEDAKLIEMWNQSRGYEAIAKATGRSMFAVEKRQQQLVWKGKLKPMKTVINEVKRKVLFPSIEAEIDFHRKQIEELESRKSEDAEKIEEAVALLRKEGYFVSPKTFVQHQKPTQKAFVKLTRPPKETNFFVPARPKPEATPKKSKTAERKEKAFAWLDTTKVNKPMTLGGIRSKTGFDVSPSDLKQHGWLTVDRGSWTYYFPNGRTSYEGTKSYGYVVPNLELLGKEFERLLNPISFAMRTQLLLVAWNNIEKEHQVKTSSRLHSSMSSANYMHMATLCDETAKRLGFKLQKIAKTNPQTGYKFEQMTYSR